VKHTLSSTDELRSDPSFAPLKVHLIQATGLEYYANREDDLARFLHKRLNNLQVQDCAAYLKILQDPLRGPPELDEMIEDLIVPETYFFRHQEHFDSLRDVVLPDLLARNRARRSLHIWCAGCADGSEPYSLAILLEREMAAELVGWEVEILATDISRRLLAHARIGKFQDWALRATSDEVKRACFLKKGKSWQIAARYKRWISFEYHNLAEDAYPPASGVPGAFDLIVCRNVMIYFAPELMQKTIQRFHEWLVESGWLLVGPSEPNITFFTAFEALNAPGVTMYRKAPPSLPFSTSSNPGATGQPAAVVSPGPSEKTSPASQAVAATLTEVRILADRGEWANAASCCEQVLRKDRLNAPVHLYHALVLEQMGRRRQAELAFKRAIYLDRQSALPHYYLGLFLRSQGETQRAALSFQNALELLAAREDGEVFPDADGMTVAEMKKLAKTHLEVLQASQGGSQL
jgi:chemotaxis protein methyltransferase CheR